MQYPLQLLTPPEATFLNSTFVNVDALRAATPGEPTAQIHPDDAAEREITTGMRVRLFNGRGSFLRERRWAPQFGLVWSSVRAYGGGAMSKMA